MNANSIFLRILGNLPAGGRQLENWILRSPLLVAFVFGIVAIFTVDRPSPAAAALSLSLLAGALFRKRLRPLVVVTVLGFVILGALHLQRIRTMESFPLRTMLETGSSYRVDGTGWFVSPTDSSTPALRITELRLRGETIPCRHTVPVRFRGKRPSLPYGEETTFSGMIRSIPGPSAPGGFDASSFYFRSLHSIAQLEIGAGDRLSPTGRNLGNPLIHFAGNTRDRMETALLSGVAEDDLDYARVVLAMTLGIREDSPEDLEDLFRQSGTLHVFAVSGLHVGIVGGAILAIALLLGLPLRYAVLVVVPLVLFYALITGLRPSAIRAAVMFSIVMASFALREKPSLPNSLGLAGLLLLAWDTQQAFLPGFQLSFAVLLAIALLAQPLQGYLHAPLEIDPFLPRRLVPRWRRGLHLATMCLAGWVAVSLAAWLGSAVLLIWHFHGIAPVGLIANVVMVPLAGVIISLAGVSIFFSSIKLSLFSIALNKINIGFTVLLTSLASLFSSLPNAYLHLAPATLKSDAGLQMTCMGFQGESASLLTLRPDGDENTQWLIDSGGPSTFQYQVLPVLRNSGINHLDGLFFSHGDQGHLGSGPEVISQLRPGVLYLSPLENRARQFPSILEASRKSRAPIEYLRKGQVLRLDNETLCRVLYPPDTARQASLADDRTLVLLFEHKGWRILCTFDAGFLVENELLKDKDTLAADVWVRGQHSLNAIESDHFLDAVNPRVLISREAGFRTNASRSNDFLQKIAHRNIHLFALETDGIVTIFCRDQELTLEGFTSGSTLSLTK